MTTRKTISFIVLFVALLILPMVAAAQEPDTPKGPDPLPSVAPSTAQPTPPALNINRTLLPKIEPQLLKRLIGADGQPVPFIVYLTTQTNTDAAVVAATAGIGIQAEPDPLTKRRVIVDALQQTARNTQGGVLQLLNSPAPGSVGAATTQVTSLWIVNAVAATGPLEIVLALAARPDVKIVRLDKTIAIDFTPTKISRPLLPPFIQPPNHLNEAVRLQPAPEWGIAKIRADLAQTALGVDGSGVTVANIDSGVDWFHPDLQAQYRGYRGQDKPGVHIGNWFDATGGGATYPVDSQGHGTHTMGTSVGHNGIGVAPGAQWIAARAFDSDGNALNSWLHQAFQWMLAPNGDPALAPDIVNNSWGSNNGFSTEFETDVELLLAAGILPVFSAGNNGPGSGTVGSPASLDISLSVGATDINDQAALFSGRGPSPWGATKPELSAPGVNVRSTLPGGAYGNFNGTSMAAPHVAGLAALLLQAAPVLSTNLDSLVDMLKSTAVPLGDPIPNDDFGWGRVDAYNALLAVNNLSSVTGTLTNAGSGLPIEDGAVTFAPTLGGEPTSTGSGSNGVYMLGLAPNFYDATASAFGFEPENIKLIEVITGTETVQNFSLSPSPSGLLAGTIANRLTGLPVSATVRIDGTPVSTTAPGGSFSLSLPVGVYTATVIATGYRITRAVGINISAGNTVVRNFLLDEAPSILVVDSGNWYQESRLNFYRQALEDALYPHDIWPIIGQLEGDFLTPTNVPTTQDLHPYDIVIWSSPLDSPGYINADDAVQGYLDGGGKLLLSGQDVAYYDGGGFLAAAPYFSKYLKAKFVADVAGSSAVSGVADEPFAGLSFTITGGDGADNQTVPDVIAVDDPDFANPLLHYEASDELASLYVGLRCLPYRAILLGFGLEGINTRTDRSRLISQSIDLLLTPPPPAGIEMSVPEETLIGNFGSTVPHTLRLRNIGATTDVLSLTVSGQGPHNWPIGSLPSPVTLEPCASETYTVTVQVPAAQTWHITDSFTLEAQSGNTPALTAVITRHTKTPAPVLLVDDDRWYSFANHYKAALAAKGIPFDYYQVPKSWVGADPPSPPLETLQMYPITVWYTAYDWFNPLTLDEEQRLTNYLGGGGRLFFSSQDFLYHHVENHSDYALFAQTYLGVQAHAEDYTSTLMQGQPDNPVGAFLGPYPFSFPAGYQNWTDAVTPTTVARIASVGQEAQPNSLTNAGVSGSGQQWRTHFLAFGPEVMTNPADHARLMQRSVGWLSWLGSSEITPESSTVKEGDYITYTAVLRNDGWSNISTAGFTATIPAYLQPVAASPGVNQLVDAFTWSGPLNAGAAHIITYTAQITGLLPLGSVINQTSWLAYPEHNILFDRITTVNVSPDLSNSKMSVVPVADVVHNDILTYTIMIKNSGTTGSPMVTTTDELPSMLNLIELVPPAVGQAISSGNRLTWTMAITRNQAATLTFRAKISESGVGIIRNTAHIDDGLSPALKLSADAFYQVPPIYMPIITKDH